MRDLASWLAAIGMSHLNVVLVEQKIDFEVLQMLDEADLKDLGVVAVGDRKRLLKAIADLNQSVVQTSPIVQGKAGQDLQSTPIAERRQLTVMFCDLVDSTELATTRDPEDYRALMTTYHDAVTKAVAPYVGHVARFLGDGVLVYFGYPYAHEDEAGRAVRAGLNVLAAVDGLELGGGLKIRTRIGIATGTVVVGEVGTGTPAAERSAAGETPNLAARLQTVARPGEIVISAETRQLLDASIELEPLGKLALKGFALLVDAWRVVAERAIASRFEARAVHGVA